MRPHPKHPPKANGVRFLPLDAGWVLVVVGLAVVTVAQRVFGL
ncbi:hypothetical protein [Caulobacter sp. DWR3-1-2]